MNSPKFKEHQLVSQLGHKPNPLRVIGYNAGGMVITIDKGKKVKKDNVILFLENQLRAFTNGLVYLDRMKFSDEEFVIGLSAPSHYPYEHERRGERNCLNTSNRVFKQFLNECIGSTNLHKFKTEEKGEQKLELARKLLIDGGYEVVYK